MKLLPSDFAERIRKGEYRTDFYPVCSNRSAWKNAAKGELQSRMVSGVLGHAERILAQGIPSIPATSYFAYRRTGNRTELQDPYYLRRTNLGILVVACCVTGDFGKYGDSIVNYLWAIMEERYWCIHAHATYGRTADVCPVDSVTRRQIDLFSAGTASLLALTLHLLEAELTQFSPRVYAILKDETLQRVVLPFLNPALNSWWTKGENNWTPWICDNVMLAGALLLKDDPSRLAFLATRSARMCGRFMDKYPENGFCSEGPDYWAKAAGALASWLLRLDKLLPGAADPVFADSKFQAMMEFPLRLMTVPDYLMNFSDGSRCMDYTPGLLEVMARKTGAQSIRELAAFAMKRLQKNSLEPDWCFSAICGEFLREVLVQLFDMAPDFCVDELPELPEKDFMADLFVNLRSAKGFSMSLKAGHNMESHNHNDLGHFTVFFNGRPLVIDLGSEVYSQKTFSAERYSLLCQGAQGHNAPIFGNVMQQPGKVYSSTLTELSPGRFLVDLSHAYPPEAQIKTLRRQLDFSADACIVEDTVEGEVPLPVTVTMFSPAEPRLENAAVVFADGIVMSADGMESIVIEPYHTNDPHLRRSWGDNLWRMTFQTNEKRWTFRFQRPQ